MFSKRTRKGCFTCPRRLQNQLCGSGCWCVLVPARPGRWSREGMWVQLPGGLFFHIMFQSIRESCQILHGLEKLYAKMPRVELSKKQLRVGPNKIGFACAKTTNYQMKCQRLCMWRLCMQKGCDRHCSYVRQGVQQSFMCFC